jgi:hypothetical protein
MTRVGVRARAGPSARLAKVRAYNYRDGPPQIQLLPFGRLSSFGSRLFIRQNKIDVTNAQRAGELKQSYDRRVTAAALQITDVLLGKSGHFGELLLREALLLPQSCEIPTD